jgi:RNA polymerase sigma-70 factor, ECF subfamily
MNTLSEMELIDLAIGGDERAFENLVRQHYHSVYRLAFKWFAVKEDAEDITQEVFVKFARKLSTFNRKSSLKTWLFRVVVNTAKDFARRHSTKRQYEAIYADELGGNNPGLSRQDSIDAYKLHSAIDRLPYKQKTSLLLVMAEGLTHKEAADILKCSETTVSWRIHQARKKLKKISAGWYDDER